ncbi:NACHT C-terminal helical domain 2-containing protein [Gloeothece citriformis]|uniref:NACHT C-terminal helical domain 2-containing protein n=1 Tax=Gloeothece citriformis TaxID=2546356 RepID=UPI000173AC5D|nr:hypothetical protein [Gloeothece citriformis]
MDLENKFSLTPAFKKAFQQLKAELPDLEENKQEILIWWQIQGQDWIKHFRKLLLEYRQIGYDWQLSPQQKEATQQYYRANEFLIECLNSDCQVSPEIREDIEENLLLPLPPKLNHER